MPVRAGDSSRRPSRRARPSSGDLPDAIWQCAAQHSECAQQNPSKCRRIYEQSAPCGGLKRMKKYAIGTMAQIYIIKRGINRGNKGIVSSGKSLIMIDLLTGLLASEISDSESWIIFKEIGCSLQMQCATLETVTI